MKHDCKTCDDCDMIQRCTQNETPCSLCLHYKGGNVCALGDGTVCKFEEDTDNGTR